MKVGIACESSSFLLKEAVKKHLTGLGYEVVDVGQQTAEDNVLYFEAAANLAKLIQSGECQRGIAICGTGAGISMVCNKFRGVYCVACESVFTAEKISLINNANVLALGGRVVGPGLAVKIVDTFLNTEFSGEERHQRRIDLIEE